MPWQERSAPAGPRESRRTRSSPTKRSRTRRPSGPSSTGSVSPASSSCASSEGRRNTRSSSPLSGRAPTTVDSGEATGDGAGAPSGSRVTWSRTRSSPSRPSSTRSNRTCSSGPGSAGPSIPSTSRASSRSSRRPSRSSWKRTVSSLGASRLQKEGVGGVRASGLGEDRVMDRPAVEAREEPAGFFRHHGRFHVVPGEATHRVHRVEDRQRDELRSLGYFAAQEPGAPVALHAMNSREYLAAQEFLLLFRVLVTRHAVPRAIMIVLLSRGSSTALDDLPDRGADSLRRLFLRRGLAQRIRQVVPRRALRFTGEQAPDLRARRKVRGRVDGLIDRAASLGREKPAERERDSLIGLEAELGPPLSGGAPQLLHGVLAARDTGREYRPDGRELFAQDLSVRQRLLRVGDENDVRAQPAALRVRVRLQVFQDLRRRGHPGVLEISPVHGAMGPVRGADRARGTDIRNPGDDLHGPADRKVSAQQIDSVE